MHTKRKHRTQAGRGLRVLLGLLLLAALAMAAGWFLLDAGLIGRTHAAALPDKLDGILIDTTPAACTLDAAALTQHLTEAADYAKAHGCNTLIVQALEQNAAGERVAFYSDHAFPAMASTTAQDTFFHRYDAMQTLCDTAATRGLTVCALFSADDVNGAGDAPAAARRSIARLVRRYGTPVFVQSGSMLLPYDADAAAAGTLTAAQGTDAAETGAGGTSAGTQGADSAAAAAQGAAAQNSAAQSTASAAAQNTAAQGTAASAAPQSTAAAQSTADFTAVQNTAASVSVPAAGQTDSAVTAYETTAAADPGTLMLADFSDPAAVFVAAVQGTAPGFVFRYSDCLADPDTYGRIVSALDTSAAAPVLPVASYTPAHTLAVTYPADGAKLYTETCFVMGTSDPAQSITLAQNGGAAVEVPQTARTGVFGVLVTLTEGENTLTFTQNGQTASVTVTRVVPAASGSAGTATLPADGTDSVPEGSYVKIAGWISSLLTDPASDGNISETVRQGGIAQVQNCVRTTRSGKRTWAYQLASGDYVMAYNTTYVGTDYTEPVFTSAQAAATAAGETLTFAGAGTPLAYTSASGSDLSLRFYSASADPAFAVQGSSMVTGAAVKALDGGVEIVLSFAQPLYGWSIEYTSDGLTQLTLKKTPVQSTVFAKPLTGVSVLLDAGHGQDDAGAMGTAGANAPLEKDVNLSVALAAQYRLQQLGATVYMVRTDDTFLTLEERNRLIAEKQPDFFIAIHHNSVELTVDANRSTGTECYYFHDSAKPLAEALVAAVTRETGRTDRGAAWGYYYVTRTTTCPAVLLELGFMVNPSEYESLVLPQTVWEEGDAIAAAVLNCVPKA